MAGTAMRHGIETLMVRAYSLGAEFEVDGSQVMVSAPEPLPDNLMRDLKSKRAELLCYLAIPEEWRPVVGWAGWLVEHDGPQVVFKETPLRTVALRLSDVDRYVTGRLGSLSLLSSWEATGAVDRKPGWRSERIDQICAALEALRQAVAPFGLAEPDGTDSHTSEEPIK